MSRFMDILLEPNGADPEGEIGDCIRIEDIAVLADGLTEPEERRKMIHHMNRCPDCYEILTGTLADMEAKQSRIFRADDKNRYGRFLAIAASCLIILFAGIYSHYISQPRVITAAIDLTADIRDLLTQDQNLEWTGSRVVSLLKILKEKGVAAEFVGKVVLNAPYFAKKDVRYLLFGPEETLRIRIEGETMYLEIVEKKEEKK